MQRRRSCCKACLVPVWDTFAEDVLSSAVVSFYVAGKILCCRKNLMLQERSYIAGKIFCADAQAYFRYIKALCRITLRRMGRGRKCGLCRRKAVARDIRGTLLGVSFRTCPAKERKGIEKTHRMRRFARDMSKKQKCIVDNNEEKS